MFAEVKPSIKGGSEYQYRQFAFQNGMSYKNVAGGCNKIFNEEGQSVLEIAEGVIVWRDDWGLVEKWNSFMNY